MSEAFREAGNSAITAALSGTLGEVDPAAVLSELALDKVFAQAEQFFFARRPLPLTEEPLGHVMLPVQWPQIPLDELGTYGVVEPRK